MEKLLADLVPVYNNDKF